MSSFLEIVEQYEEENGPLELGPEDQGERFVEGNEPDADGWRPAGDEG